MKKLSLEKMEKVEGGGTTSRVLRYTLEYFDRWWLSRRYFVGLAGVC